MRDDTPDAIEWSWAFLARMLGSLGLRVCALYLPRRLWNDIRAELRDLETLARRLVLVMALSRYGEPQGRPQRTEAALSLKIALSPLTPSSRAKPRDARQMPAPAFPLLDTLPRPLFPGTSDPWWDGLPESGAARPAAPLQARLAALARLIAEPERACARMMGWLARFRARRAGRRSTPIRLAGRPARGDPLCCLTASTCFDLQDRAIAGLNALGP